MWFQAILLVGKNDLALPEHLSHSQFFVIRIHQDKTFLRISLNFVRVWRFIYYRTSLRVTRRESYKNRLFTLREHLVVVQVDHLSSRLWFKLFIYLPGCGPYCSTIFLAVVYVVHLSSWLWSMFFIYLPGCGLGCSSIFLVVIDVVHLSSWLWSMLFIYLPGCGPCCSSILLVVF